MNYYTLYAINNNLSQGLVFVVGTEDMSKFRFIWMCLCPNIFLGLIPYIIFLIFPKYACILFVLNVHA